MVKTEDVLKYKPTYIGENHHSIWFRIGLVNSIYTNNLSDNMRCSMI